MFQKQKSCRHNILLTIFPTPNFLAMPSVGMSFSDTHIRFIEFINKGITKTFEVGDYATVELPKGVIVNGDIRDTKKLGELVAELKKDFDFSYVRAALPEQKGYLYKTQIPYLEKEDIRDSVGFSVEENAPISINDAVFDFDIIGVNEKKKKVDVVVTVFPKEVIDKYVSVLEYAGLTPLGFELEALAVAKSVIKVEDPDTYIVVDYIGEKVGLYVVSKNIVHFTTTIYLGKESVSGTGGAFSLKDIDMSNVDLLKKEIEKLAGYWKSHGGEEVSAVVLTGIGLKDSKYQQSLSDVLDIKVAVADVWQNIFSFDEYIPGIPADDAVMYAASIGLALFE